MVTIDLDAIVQSPVDILRKSDKDTLKPGKRETSYYIKKDRP
jgi:hypothetical protein